MGSTVTSPRRLPASATSRAVISLVVLAIWRGSSAFFSKRVSPVRALSRMTERARTEGGRDGSTTSEAAGVRTVSSSTAVEVAGMRRWWPGALLLALAVAEWLLALLRAWWWTAAASAAFFFFFLAVSLVSAWPDGRPNVERPKQSKSASSSGRKFTVAPVRKIGAAGKRGNVPFCRILPRENPYLPISRARSVALRTAPMKAARIPASSKVSSAAIVVPPGLHTASRSRAG